MKYAMLGRGSIIKPDDEVLCGLYKPRKLQEWVRYGDVQDWAKQSSRKHGIKGSNSRTPLKVGVGDLWQIGQVRRKVP